MGNLSTKPIGAPHPDAPGYVEPKKEVKQVKKTKKKTK